VADSSKPIALAIPWARTTQKPHMRVVWPGQKTIITASRSHPTVAHFNGPAGRPTGSGSSLTPSTQKRFPTIPVTGRPRDTNQSTIGVRVIHMLGKSSSPCWSQTNHSKPSRLRTT